MTVHNKVQARPSEYCCSATVQQLLHLGIEKYCPERIKQKSDIQLPQSNLLRSFCMDPYKYSPHK